MKNDYVLQNLQKIFLSKQYLKIRSWYWSSLLTVLTHMMLLSSLSHAFCRCHCCSHYNFYNKNPTKNVLRLFVKSSSNSWPIADRFRLEHCAYQDSDSAFPYMYVLCIGCNFGAIIIIDSQSLLTTLQRPERQYNNNKAPQKGCASQKLHSFKNYT